VKRILAAILGCFFLMHASAQSSSVIEHLADEIAVMQEGDDLHIGYTFEGCYGPYHRGSFDLLLQQDTIHFVSKSYDSNEKEPFVESGKYHRDRLVDLLDEAKKEESSEILGNVINYAISSQGETYHKGSDRIAQRHFIELFHPFTSLFKPKKEFAIPKISSGGFVH